VDRRLPANILDNLHGMTQVERMFDMASVVLFAVTMVERMFDTA